MQFFNPVPLAPENPSSGADAAMAFMSPSPAGEDTAPLGQHRPGLAEMHHWIQALKVFPGSYPKFIP